MRRSPTANQRAYLHGLACTLAAPTAAITPAPLRDRLRSWVHKHLAWLVFLAVVFLLARLDSARATDIELAPVDDAAPSLAILSFVCAAPLPALAALVYGLLRARRPATNEAPSDRHPTLETVR